MIPMLFACLGLHAFGQDSPWVAHTRYFGATDDQAVYEVKQDDVVLDFKGGVILSGKPLNPDRSQFTGTGLLIQGRKNVTIKNLTVKGYRFNIRIVDSKNVRLENCQASVSRTLRMAQDGKPIDTFMNLRDIDVWRSYGAGIWVEKSMDVTVTKCSANDAQNGLILVDTTGTTVYDNDFSFNSGWGICLGRSSDNTVSWNKTDFCNRPWSGSWGGDSAAIAVADSSHRNYFVGNSMTHSGDGFFLTHKSDDFREADRKITLYGPSNDNVIAYNDGSWSTANAFEGTFSTGNVYYKNWANDSAAAGFWLGYADDSLVLDNKIMRNGTYGVAIEHGRVNVIQRNEIGGTKGAAIGLWSSGDWKTAAKPSTQNDVFDNVLKENTNDFDLRHGDRAFIKDPSTVREAFKQFVVSTPNTQAREDRFRKDQLPRVEEILKTRPKDFVFYREADVPRGFGWIQIDDWAPRNFANQLAAWRQPDPCSVELYLLETGVRVAAPNFVRYDETPEDPRLVRISVKPDPNEAGKDQPIQISLASGDSKHRQVVNAILRTATWTVKWYAWPTLTYDDREGWNSLFAGDPLLQETTHVLGGDYYGRSPGPGVPVTHFAMVATTKVKLEPGKYAFSSLSDDGIRVFVDGKEIISRWNHHGAEADEATVDLDEKVHEIRVEYCQEDGGAVLRFDWRKVS